MKIKDVLILAFIFIMPISLLFLPTLAEAGSSWRNAQGYKVTLLEYDGTTQTKLASILLYTDDLVQKVSGVKVGASDVPKTFDEFVNNKYHVTQIVDTSSPTLKTRNKGFKSQTGQWVENEVVLRDLPGFYSNPNTSNVTSPGTVEWGPSNSFESVTEKIYYDYDNNNSVYKSVETNVKKANRKECKSGWNDYIFNYMTNQYKVTYLGGIENISNAKTDYNHTYKENTVSPSTIDSLIETKYAKNAAAIEGYFGVKLDYSKIDKYYISVEPVERYLPTDRSGFKVTGTYYISSLSKVKEERQQLVTDSSHCSSGYKCKSWIKEKNNKCACYDSKGKEVKKCNGKKCITQYSSQTLTEEQCSKKSNNSYSNGTCYYGCKTHEKVNCNNCDCDTWYHDSIFNGSRIVHKFYGKTATSKSKIIVVTSGSKLGRAVNSCDREMSKHCERTEIEAKLSDDGKTATFVKKRYSNNEPLSSDGNSIISVCKTTDSSGKEKYASKYTKVEEKTSLTDDWKPKSGSYKVAKYQYYIGPNKDKALVGTTSKNPYKLVGNCAKDGKQGIRHYYPKNFPSFNCSSVCGSISNKNSDEFLTCAENYCDAEVDFNLNSNVRVRKRNCIIACGYKKESGTNCSKANPYAGKDKDVTATSTCNISSNNNLSEKKGIITTCVGDNITDFDENDTNDPRFDGRRYINVACKETSSFEISDVSSKNYTQGEGIDYTIDQDGKKECQAFFDYDQWKFDYATISSKDPDRRKRLKYIYTVFNNQLQKEYNVTTNSYYDKDFADQDDGEVHWNDYKYDVNKTTITGSVTQIINNVEKNSGTINLDRVSTKDNSSQEVMDDTEKIKLIANNVVSTEKINRYLSTSKLTAKYKFKKACIKQDGTEENNTTKNICYTTKNDSTETKVYSKRVYYTNMSITPNSQFIANLKKTGKTHKVEAKITVGKTGATGDKYYSDEENCPFTIIKSNTGRNGCPNCNGKSKAQCFIDIKENTGTTFIGNNIYIGGSITTQLRYKGEFKNGDTVVEKTIIINGEMTTADTKTVAIENSSNSVQDFVIYGTIKLSNGNTYTCPGGTIHLLKHTSCGMSCRIDKKTDTLHSIKNTGATATKVKESTTEDMNRKVVEKSVSTERYDVRTSQRVTTEIRNGKRILFGYVGNGSCNNYCEKEIDECAEGACPEVENCETKFKPGQVGEITLYCNANYDTDINGYLSPEDCILKCTKDACPDNCMNESEIDTFCGNQTNVNRAGFKNSQECKNVCICTGSGDYIYRTVSNLDPFPQSKESPMYKGERSIGKNWYGLSGYITDDGDDDSSVTGIKKNTKVEYIIDLSPKDIKEVRKTNSSDGIAAYTKFKYAKKYNSKYKSSYMSAFIHDKYSKLFKNGIKTYGKYLEAVQDTK